MNIRADERANYSRSSISCHGAVPCFQTEAEIPVIHSLIWISYDYCGSGKI